MSSVAFVLVEHPGDSIATKAPGECERSSYHRSMRGRSVGTSLPKNGLPDEPQPAWLPCSTPAGPAVRQRVSVLALLLI